MNSANRNFAGLAVVSTVIAMLALCLGVGCVLAVLLVAGIASNGLAAGPDAVLPAIGFIAIVVTGAALGLASLRRQLRASRSLAHRVDAITLPLSGELHRAAHRAGLAGRVKLVDSEERFSVRSGCWRGVPSFGWSASGGAPPASVRQTAAAEPVKPWSGPMPRYRP